MSPINSFRGSQACCLDFFILTLSLPEKFKCYIPVCKKFVLIDVTLMKLVETRNISGGE